MSTLFDDLKQGLQEAIAYEKGQGTARIKTYTIAPVKEYSSAEIWLWWKMFFALEQRGMAEIAFA